MQRNLPGYCLSLCLLLLSPASAQTDESVFVNDELEVPVTRYEAFAEQAPILLWLPSSRGISSRQAITSSALADLDVETWALDLHTAYFIDAGRSSVEHFQARDIADLITIAGERSTGKVFILATGGVSKPALEGIARYQQDVDATVGSSVIGGIILFHPALNIPVNRAGETATYVPIASNSTIPVYYIQPSISTRQSRSDEIQQVLQSGGSQVFFHPLPGVSAGFHLRPEDDLNEADMEQYAALPKTLKRAIEILKMQGPVPAPEFIADASSSEDRGPRFGLKPLSNSRAQTLLLNDFNAQEVGIDYSDHALTLVSFWTSWCPPCIKELPSLKRLHDDYKQQGLQIITINMGESKADLASIFSRFDLSGYKNLRDPDGNVMNAWNVYAFPTNFLITSSGTLSHGSIGGVEWDEPEVRAVVESLLDSQR